MVFRELAVVGVFALGLEERRDSRGFFARTFCQQEFVAKGLAPVVAQCNISWNRVRGTLRGLHFQRGPKPEAKLVRCTRGTVYDVIIDLRPTSATFRRWCSAELSAANRLAIYIPPGCAHGYQTLTDDTELFYQISECYDPTLSAGVRWNDPAFGVDWPIIPPILSDRDSSYADFQP